MLIKKFKIEKSRRGNFRIYKRQPIREADLKVKEELTMDSDPSLPK
jgi:hypothetical protein